MKETFLCPECGSENIMNYQFCGACGAKLVVGTQQSERTCSHCDTKNPPKYRFCGKCGARLDTDCPNCGVIVPADSRYCPNCAYLCGEGRLREK